MQKIFPTLLILLVLLQTIAAQVKYEYPAPALYGTGEWDEDSLGNHRVVLNIEDKADIVRAIIPWRRRDHDPEKKGIIIIDADSGERIQNILKVSISREYADILFQPKTVPGEYHVYYMKHIMYGRINYPTVTYPEILENADQDWLVKANIAGKNMEKLPKAKLVQFQSIDQFNSLYPMELIATKEEVDELILKNPGADYLLFPEHRENPIRMKHNIPLKWIQDGVTNQFTGKVLKGEYFVFQVGVFALGKDLEKIRVKFSGLSKQGKEIIDPQAFTCFNTGGIDLEGKSFEKECNLNQNNIQALWMGIQIPENIEPGKYEGQVFITPRNSGTSMVELKIEILDKLIIASGDNEPVRLSRLHWLNSTIAQDDGIVPPYTPLKLKDNTIHCLGRSVNLGEDGFPESIQSYFSESVTRIQDQGKEILSGPIRFVIEKDQMIESWDKLSWKIIKQAEGAVAWEIHNEMPGLRMDGVAQMEFDGNIDYKVILSATEDIALKDIRLEIPLQVEAAEYMMGLGQVGGYRPDKVKWKWAVEKNQDGPWVGDVNAGIQVRFRDNNYARPLNTNFYLSNPLYMPDSWYNQGEGGININDSEDGCVLISSYSGERLVRKGEQLHFYFNILITPFRPLDTDKHWHNRYFHSYKPVDEIIAYGGNTVNIHHGNEINPFINYPFLRPDEMKAYIDEAHKQGLKVKIYYTVRELANRAPELFALRSLGEEIFSPGKGGGYTWLQEHLDSSYIAAWFVPEYKDAAIINSGVSRWHNFYLEGIHWLVENVGIDGLYIDDVAFDRTTMKRVRKILERGNPGSLIDLHSANQFNPKDGLANSANLYLEHFPYLDRLWFGEYFDYDLPPEFWLIETSGIPFGLMGEMLQGGGNPWRGMLFGMTSRAPWSGDPAPIWELWDDFGISDSEMIGFWDPACPVSTNHEKVMATTYVKEKEILIALGNWEATDVEIKLDINWKKTSIDPRKANLIAPGIESFQSAGQFDPEQTLKVPGGKGYLLILK